MAHTKQTEVGRII